jgi:uncharacterized NAD(P)/FAD-binding protein YdhS
MKSDRPLPVAIIGGGASGTILAAQLARRGVSSVLIDGSGRIGRGVAYSTRDPAHLLNVRAEGMSAWSGEPAHFTERFSQEGGDGRAFAQRRFYGRYLGEVLDEAVATGHVACLGRTAIGAARAEDSWSVTLDGGEQLSARALVLSTGNQEPERLKAFEGVADRFVANPWGSQAQAALGALGGSDADVLLIGTGLTMVDLVLSLEAAGHGGAIVALSRRGLMPRAHADFTPAPVAAEDVPLCSVRTLARWLRRRSAEVGWRAAIDSLRPHSHAIWQSFGEDEQRRFMRHARPWWDVQRHRIAPEVAELLVQLIGAGRLQVLAGRVEAVRSSQSGIEVDIRRRGSSQVRPQQFAYAFNCTGPLQAIGRSKDPLLRGLLASGDVGPDHLGIGIAVDQRSRASGERIWALGPLTKGRYWEIVAVPDIREQAAAVAADIAEELGR